MDSLTLLYDFGKTKVLQRFFIAKGCKRKHGFLQVRHYSTSNPQLTSSDSQFLIKLSNPQSSTLFSVGYLVLEFQLSGTGVSHG